MKGIFLAWSGTIKDVFSQWEQFGFFDYILPFLLIFALVFGILTKTRIFEKNKAINAIIALAVGLMALQFGFVSQFFSEILPRLGIGLMVILIILILVGLFLNPKNKGMMGLMFAIGMIIIIVILVKTAGAFGWTWNFWQENLPLVVGIVIILAILGIIIAASSKWERGPQSESILSRALRGESEP